MEIFWISAQGLASSSVEEDDILTGLKLTRAGHSNQRCHGLAAIDGVEEKPLGLSGDADRLDRSRRGLAVARTNRPVIDEGSFFFEASILHIQKAACLKEDMLDFCTLMPARRTYAYAQDLTSPAQECGTEKKPGLSAAAASWQDNVIECGAAGLKLGEQLKEAINISKRANCIRSSDRNDERPPSCPAFPRSNLFHNWRAFGTRWRQGDLSSKNTIDKDVTVVIIGGAKARHRLGEDEDAPHIESRCRRGGLAGMIGLDGSCGNERISLGRQGCANQKFELTSLVAAAREPRAVVAFDPYVGSAEPLGKPLKPFERRWCVCDSCSWKRCEWAV